MVQEGPVGTLHRKASLNPKTREVVVGSSPTLQSDASQFLAPVEHCEEG